MSISSYIARRYLSSSRKISLVGIITAMAIVGIAVSAFAMVVVLSVFAGLRELNEDSMDSIYPSIEISPATGKTITADASTLTLIGDIEGIEYVSRTLTEKAFVRYRTGEIISRIKGIDTSYLDVVDIDSMIVGDVNFDDDRHSIPHALVGVKVAYLLQMNIPDHANTLTAYVPQSGTTTRALSSFYRDISFYPTAYFTGHADEENIIYVPLSAMQELMGRSEMEIGAIEIKVNERYDEEKIASALRDKLGDVYNIRTSSQLKSLMHKIINIENAVLYFVFVLILIIAMAGIVGAVIMLILEKKDNVYTLRAMGMSKKQIRRIFIYEGLMSLWIGAGIGLACGIALVVAQETFSFITIAGTTSIPYPVSLTLWNIIITVCSIGILGYLSTLVATAGVKDTFYEKRDER